MGTWFATRLHSVRVSMVFATPFATLLAPSDAGHISVGAFRALDEKLDAILPDCSCQSCGRGGQAIPRKAEVKIQGTCNDRSGGMHRGRCLAARERISNA